jgi:hypothetical protein
MDKKQIIPGKKYALRDSGDTEFQLVKVLEQVRGKWKVEWIDPNPGLVDYVKSRAIICPWSERKAFAKDEQNAVMMKERIARSWPGEKHPLNVAAEEVISATGDQVILMRGILEGRQDALERVAERAGYKWPPGGFSYTDRHGECHYPWETAIELAKAFAAAEPQTVLLHIDIVEREWEIEATHPGSSYLVYLLEEYRAAWAIVRQWASFDADRARLHAEIERLRKLIDEAIWRLRKDNVDPENVSRWLSRSVKGG